LEASLLRTSAVVMAVELKLAVVVVVVVQV
jgi:hypothetical protein